jgi:hypothetical protein
MQARSLSEDDIGLYVRKTGRTTEHTQGFVQTLFATVQVKYNLFQKATFVDQIIISQSPAEEDFSNGGDSGSLVYDTESRVIGLLFAGSEGSEGEPATTIVNPIQFVLNQLNVELLSAGEHPSLAAVATRRRAREAVARETPTAEAAPKEKAPKKKAPKKQAPSKKPPRKKAPAKKATPKKRKPVRRRR